MGIDRLVEKKWLKTKTFLINGRLLFNTKKKVLNESKSNIFPLKNVDEILTPEPTPKPTSKATKKTNQETFI